MPPRRVENPNRPAEAITGNDRGADRVAEAARDFPHHPGLDVKTAILQQIASGTDNIAQALGLDFLFTESVGEMGLRIICKNGDALFAISVANRE